MLPQIRLRTLLKEDTFYKQWFMRPPTITVHHTLPPWRLFVQAEQGGRWQRVDLPGYVKAYAQVKLRLPDAWDMTIHCKPQGFRPPVLRVDNKKQYMGMPQDHTWCVHCRRPTIFKYFTKHPNLPYRCDPEESRCGICGARRSTMKEFHSTLAWPLRLETAP